MASTLTRTSSEQAGLSEMLNQLDALMQSKDYNENCLMPTSTAQTRMREFLMGANGCLKSAFPLGTLYADGDGGLRLEWIRPERELRLVVSASPEGRSYLYHEQGIDYGADYSPTVSKLGRWLNWLEN